mmetsp:Transcript_38204/g.99214  ORF Transcript_38204/g.99214 Transcript_38204/m.99214 type:complete len:275 (-) Transcript_38204:83-907(-)
MERLERAASCNLLHCHRLRDDVPGVRHDGCHVLHPHLGHHRREAALLGDALLRGRQGVQLGVQPAAELVAAGLQLAVLPEGQAHDLADRHPQIRVRAGHSVHARAAHALGGLQVAALDVLLHPLQPVNKVGAALALRALRQSRLFIHLLCVGLGRIAALYDRWVTHRLEFSFATQNVPFLHQVAVALREMALVAKATLRGVRQRRQLRLTPRRLRLPQADLQLHPNLIADGAAFGGRARRLYQRHGTAVPAAAGGSGPIRRLVHGSLAGYGPVG